MTFKKTILKTLAVTTVVGAVMAMSSVVAMAASTTWIYDTDGITFPEAFGAITYSTDTPITGSGIKAAFKEGIFADGVKAVDGKKGLDLSAQVLDTDNTRMIYIEPAEDGRYEFFALRTSGSDTKLRTYTIKGTSKTQLAEYGTDGGQYGRDSIDVEPVILDAKLGTKYAFYGNSSSGVALYAIRFTPASEVVYLPEEKEPTAKEEKVYGVEAKNLTNKNATANGASTTGDTSHNSYIVLGSEVNASASNPGDWGYISFTANGTFTVAVDFKSSGDGIRTIHLGTSTDNGVTFTELKASESLVSGTAFFNVTEGENTTYYIYVTSADNVHILKTDLYEGDVVTATAPSVTLPETVSVVGDKVQVVATFNDFSKNAFEVESINLRAALGQNTQEATQWIDNDITNIKDVGDGTITFTANTAEVPSGKTIFQVVATYKGIDPHTESIQSAEAVSNVATYNPAPAA